MESIDAALERISAYRTHNITDSELENCFAEFETGIYIYTRLLEHEPRLLTDLGDAEVQRWLASSVRDADALAMEHGIIIEGI